MDGLPTELLLESLSLLTVPTIAIVGNINKLMRELTEEKWLIRQFSHCQIDSKPVFRDKLVNMDIKTDITDQLLKISQDSYQSNEQLLWCLVQCIARNTACAAAGDAAGAAAGEAVRAAACATACAAACAAAWETAWETAGEAALEAALEAAGKAAWETACAASWDAVRVAARDPAWDAAWDAVRVAAQDAVCDAAQDAVCDAARTAARDATWTAINNHQITDLKLIGQLAYIAAERTILIKLPEIVKSCRAILTEKIPNYREIVSNFEIPTDTTNPFFLQYRQLFVTK